MTLTGELIHHGSSMTSESWMGDHWFLMREEREGLCTWSVGTNLGTGARARREGGDYEVGLADAIAQVRAALDELGLPGQPERITGPREWQGGPPRII